MLILKLVRGYSFSLTSLEEVAYSDYVSLSICYLVRFWKVRVVTK